MHLFVQYFHETPLSLLITYLHILTLRIEEGMLHAGSDPMILLGNFTADVRGVMVLGAPGLW